MFYNKLILIGLVVCCNLSMWGQEYQWNIPFFVDANMRGSTKYDMQTDLGGNTYLLASFKEEITLEDTTLFSTKEIGVYLAKYSTSHELIWVHCIAEANEGNPNMSSIINHLELEIDKEGQFVYPVISYTDTTLLNELFYTVDQSQVYYNDIAILKLSFAGNIEKEMYHIKGSCTTYIGDVHIKDEYLYFHMSNSRHQLESDSVCSCTINSDTTIYSTDDEAIIGRINQNLNQVDWVQTYNAGGSGISSGEMSVIDNQLYLSGGVHSSLDLVIEDDSLIVPGIYSKYSYVARFDLEEGHEWTRYFAVMGWDSYGFPIDLEVNSNNDIVVVANVESQSTSNMVFFQNGPTLSECELPSNDRSFLVVNYDSLGNVKWHDISTSIGYESMRSVDFDSHHNLYLIGGSSSNFTFDGLTPALSGMLVISYDANGNKRWAKSAGVGSGSTLRIDSLDIIHIAGFVNNSKSEFGPYAIQLPNEGNSIFMAQMNLEPLGLEDATPQQFGVNIYPNPSLGQINIHLENEWISEVKIYDALGQEVQSISVESQKEILDVSNLLAGYYIIDIRTESGKRVAKKILVK